MASESMSSAQANAFIASLRAQRNTALDHAAQLQSELTVAKEVIAALQKKLTQVCNPPPDKEAIPA